MRFLVVDDDPVCRKMLSSLLTNKYGAVVTVASNGMEAIRSFTLAHEERQPYAAAFVDINMPGITGHTVIRRVREIEAANQVSKEAAARLIMITASDSREDVLSASGVCDAYLLKPLDIGRLHECLTKFGLIRAMAVPPANAVAPSYEEGCQQVLDWCDRDSIPSQVLTKMIVRMTASIARQSGKPGEPAKP